MVSASETIGAPAGENRRAQVLSEPDKADAGAASTATAALRYLGLSAAIVVAGLAAVWNANRSFAPEMYSDRGPKVMAEALAKGQNWATFDLNINIREMRDHHLSRLDYTPDVVVLGASHWQEAHAGLVRHKRMFNAHIHRDYWEDPLGMVELFVSHNRLPKQMIIAVRDNQFLPVERRRDFLWLPGIPYYRDMARRLDIEAQPWIATLPTVRWREQLSLPMLHTNVTRWYSAPAHPHATLASKHPTLDILMPDGSIVWSEQHQRGFTPERTERLSAEFALEKIKHPPKIDPKGVAAFEALLTFLKRREVEVFLAHPPYNPAFWERVQGTPYMAGMRAVEQLTRDLAERYGARVIGGFDPASVGCERHHYIDAEHSNAECLGRLFDQYTALDTAMPAALPPAAVAAVPASAGKSAARHAGGRPQALPAVAASVGTPPLPAVAEEAGKSRKAADRRKLRRADKRTRNAARRSTQRPASGALALNPDSQ